MKPIAGSKLFSALKDEPSIILAANGRIDAGVFKGIFRAAKEQDAALIMELAKSEGGLDGGYSGFAPDAFSQACLKAAEEVGFDIWALHADHIAVKKGTSAEIDQVKN